MKEVNLLVSDEQLAGLFEKAETRKQSVSVDKETLSKLLIDYNRMHEALRGNGSFTVTTPQPPKRARATIG